ncbi:MAG: GNAT family N-acetyltransferase [Spirochaetes bacterium]|nr:GNAT family N-acetyltransferase [Spirochaetota bacterium]
MDRRWTRGVREDPPDPPGGEYRLADFTMEYYEPAVSLWRSDSGIGSGPADERGQIALFLRRNPGLSLVALRDDRVVGTVLCGHDGRRGFLYHLYVLPEHRRRGVGRMLADRAIRGLRGAGVTRCHIMVFLDNEAGRRFWEATGFWFRSDIGIMSLDLETP